MTGGIFAGISYIPWAIMAFPAIPEQKKTAMTQHINPIDQALFSIAKSLGVDEQELEHSRGARLAVLLRALLHGHAVKAQFFRFGLVGVAGFAVDIAVLALCSDKLGLGLYAGRLVSFMAAVTTTWALNRTFTFRHEKSGSMPSEWAKFVVVNIGGGIVNYLVYAALVASQPYVAAHPWAGVATGSLAGMLVNFFTSKKMVFK